MGAEGKLRREKRTMIWMKALSQVCVVFALIIALAPSLLADSTLKGVVTDSTGASIAGALVIIHLDPAAGLISAVDRKDIIVRTDGNGAFSVKLPASFYDVFISSPAFTPVCTKIRAYDDKVVTFNSKLGVSSIVTDETGFRISTAPK